MEAVALTGSSSVSSSSSSSSSSESSSPSSSTPISSRPEFSPSTVFSLSGVSAQFWSMPLSSTVSMTESMEAGGLVSVLSSTPKSKDAPVFPSSPPGPSSPWSAVDASRPLSLETVVPNGLSISRDSEAAREVLLEERGAVPSCMFRWSACVCNARSRASSSRTLPPSAFSFFLPLGGVFPRLGGVTLRRRAWLSITVPSLRVGRGLLVEVGGGVTDLLPPTVLPVSFNCSTRADPTS
mmetsp:Transcript_22502/g.43127  ORF Transcript_22502/g.43127 Transcript_22502/m.43127 type:complete len:238 (-) Transcript_22502:2546-3259(-)